jgi:hypothetical protein
MQRITRLLTITLLIALLAPIMTPAQAQAKADLAAIKTYLTGKTAELKKGGATLKTAADAYYGLASGVKFDYAALEKTKFPEAKKALAEAKAAWLIVSPLYEQIEGIVAGVPVLMVYDPILDSGIKDEVEYDLIQPDGKKLAKPGNLFGLLETSLWGTEKSYVKATVDLDGDSKVGFGDVLPDAVLVKTFADGMAKYTADLHTDAEKWKPTESDAFTALVVMVPTMKEYFNAWKESRFVLGDKSTSAEFSVISRLSDIVDIVGSLEVVYKGVSPLVASKDSALDKQITSGLTDLRKYAADLLSQEQKGKKFTPEQADLFATEAQANADAITGKIAQVAAQLGIKLAVE